MAKSRNNLLGVGGQRKKLSRADQQAGGPARNADRRAADDHKQELVRKMRERARAQPEGGPQTETDSQSEGGPQTETDSQSDAAPQREQI